MEQQPNGSAGELVLVLNAGSSSVKFRLFQADAAGAPADLANGQIEGIEGIVFTAGIGEHGQAVRKAVCTGLGWLGLEFDAAANALDATVISTAESRVEIRVIPTNEEMMIALHALRVLGRRGRA